MSSLEPRAATSSVAEADGTANANAVVTMVVAMTGTSTAAVTRLQTSAGIWIWTVAATGAMATTCDMGRREDGKSRSHHGNRVTNHWGTPLNTLVTPVYVLP